MADGKMCVSGLTLTSIADNRPTRSSTRFTASICGEFCGYTPSKECEFVGIAHNFKRIVCGCQLLYVSDVEQRLAVLSRANFELLISRLIAKPRFQTRGFWNAFCGEMKDCV